MTAPPVNVARRAVCWLAAVAVLQDVALWHKLADMSLENGFIRQAIYCYNKVRAAWTAPRLLLWQCVPA